MTNRKHIARIKQIVAQINELDSVRSEIARKHNMFQSSETNPFSDEMRENNSTFDQIEQELTKIVPEAYYNGVRPSTLRRILGESENGRLSIAVRFRLEAYTEK